MQDAERENELDTGKEDEEIENEEKESMQKLEDEEKDATDVVRFQYDGALKMKVDFAPRADQLECDANPSSFRDADSFHVIEYMTLFDVTVSLEYEILEGLFCDIVDSDVTIEITNNLGYDSFSGSVEFKERILTTGDEGLDIALKYCNADEECKLDGKDVPCGPCYEPIQHELDDEGNEIGGASTRPLVFATGRPNIVAPYTKSVIFRVFGVDVDVVHKAEVFITGLYSKGPGQSFALPTHEPIMVLHDPPGNYFCHVFVHHVLSLHLLAKNKSLPLFYSYAGGLSYTSYENVVTTFKLKSEEHQTSMKNNLSLGFDTKFDSKVLYCAGAGYGIVGVGMFRTLLYCEISFYPFS